MPNPNENNPGHGGDSPGHGPAPVTIIVNGTAYEVPKEKISYEELLQLIGAPPLPEGKRYSVVYSKGNSGKPTGTLLEGESVQVKKDMEFDVTPANRS
ncbi:multiubiquitin domain-containing protein [Bradyrhizobium sp. B117]|uniref:multiubiquitin domain-containing protein n=1 Tax=Bradyrhizobium sp. B117 TaxID=3140246 RepID=UPI0031844257